VDDGLTRAGLLVGLVLLLRVLDAMIGLRHRFCRR